MQPTASFPSCWLTHPVLGVHLIVVDNGTELLLHSARSTQLHQDLAGLVLLSMEDQPSWTLGHEEEPNKHDNGRHSSQT